MKNILIMAGVIIVFGFLGAFLMGGEEKVSFEYRGVNFTVETFCDAKPCLVTYNTKLPIMYEGKPTKYNFFFRNDPRKLENSVPFEGEFKLEREMEFEITYGRSCEGYEAVAMDNFGTVFRISGTTVKAKENLSCGSEDGTMYVKVQEGDRTWIEKTGDSCYEINIRECEIIKGTERFLIEALVDVNENL